MPHLFISLKEVLLAKTNFGEMHPSLINPDKKQKQKKTIFPQ